MQQLHITAYYNAYYIVTRQQALFYLFILKKEFKGILSDDKTLNIADALEMFVLFGENK